MAAVTPQPNEFVTAYELTLLRAALLEGPASAAAAQRWAAYHSESGKLHQLEPGARRLLPLLYKNAKPFLPAELHPELRQIQLEYWADNQKRFRKLAEVLAWFEGHKVPTLVLKGMALSVLHYKDMRLRPTADADILIPEQQAPTTIEKLAAEGWMYDYHFPDASKSEYFYRHAHGVSLKHADYGDVDLHWHVLRDATFSGADHAFWADSVPLQIHEITTRSLSPTDQLLHACVHGYKANVVAPIRWVADAITVLRTSEIDWTRLVRVSRELRVSIPTVSALAFLQSTFPTSIPSEVLDELAAIPIDAAERRYFERQAQLEIHLRGILADNLERHRRANRDRHPILSLLSLPRQFQLHYNLPRLSDFGGFVLSLLTKRIRRGLTNL
jgi:putative nucleotidyltransferase-like protein